MVSILLVVYLSFWGDSAVYNFMARMQSPAGVEVFKAVSATSGKEGVLLIPMAYSFLGGEEAHENFKPMLVGGAVSGAVVFGIKYLTNRPRPDGDYTRANSSFPSGHAAASFYYATYIGALHPKAKWPLYTWATCVAVSRMYLQRHWLSDVVVGGLIGWAVARLTLKYGGFIKELKIYE